MSLGNKPLRVLVCGSRRWKDHKAIAEALSIIAERYGISVVVHGDAPGADRYAGNVAKQRGIPVSAYPARWSVHGNAAGPIRNSEMLKEGNPELVLAFTYDLSTSRGTADMVRKAKAAGVKVVELPREREALRALVGIVENTAT